MTVAELIQDISKRKAEMGITNQMLSDASGVPKTTVDRILRGDTPNPSMQTVLDMAYVVGYRLVNDNDTSNRPINSQLVEALERESRLKTIQHNLIMAEKDRAIATKDKWIHQLYRIILIMGLGVILVLLLDVLIRGIGWLP